MAKRTPDETDRAALLVTGEINDIDPSAWVSVRGAFNLWIWGVFTGSLALTCSFDAGETILPVTAADGTPQTFTGPGRIVIDEPESGVVYRLEAAAGLTGVAHWRISK